MYREFIEAASQAYIDALTSDTPDLPKAIQLYALISRMRVLSSPRVIEEAEKIARSILDSYSEPNKTLEELRIMVRGAAMDPLREFSQACREELHLPYGTLPPPSYVRVRIFGRMSGRSVWSGVAP